MNAVSDEQNRSCARKQRGGYLDHTLPNEYFHIKREKRRKQYCYLDRVNNPPSIDFLNIF